MHSLSYVAGSARILLAAVSNGTAEDVRSLFEEQGHRVEFCGDDEAAAERVVDPELDLILLGPTPDAASGRQLLERVRQYQETPVIVLAPSGANRDDRIAAFECGADDFLIDPVDTLELKLRANVLLRRTTRGSMAGSQPEQLQLGSLLLSRRSQEVQVGKVSLSFTPIQFKLLWSLAQRHNEVLSRAYLHERVLGKAFSQFDRSVDMHLSRVRRKLIQAGMAADCLQTVRSQGYCLTL